MRGTQAVPAAPDPVDYAQQLVDNIGDPVVDAALGIAPLAVPFLLALFAIRWALHKFGLGAHPDRYGSSLPTYVTPFEAHQQDRYADDDHSDLVRRMDAAYDAGRANRPYAHLSDAELRRRIDALDDDRARWEREERDEYGRSHWGRELDKR